MGSGVVAREVVVRGSVQGVMFRASCADRAARVGVAGWVRNESDGSVRAWFEGPVAGVEALVAWCGHGPRHAVVEAVEVEERAPQGLVDFAER